MNPGLVEWSDVRVLAGNALLMLAAILWALGSCLYLKDRFRSPFHVQTFWQLAVSIVPVGAIMLTGLAGGPIRWYAALVAIIAYTGTDLDANRRFRAVYADIWRRAAPTSSSHRFDRRWHSCNPAS
jgi:hypothetical protein